MNIRTYTIKELYRMFVNYGTGKVVIYDKTFLVAGDIRESVQPFMNEYLNMDYIRNEQYE